MRVNLSPIRNDINKPLLVLDLDETLIYSSKTPLYQKHSFKVFSLYVYKRPDLDKFILEMNELYSLAIWSAASDIYVKKVAENILPRKVETDFIWGRSKCNFIGNKDKENNSDYVKNLHTLTNYNYSIDKILILDDTPRVCMKNLNNAIFPKPFYGESHDEELNSVSKYLKLLAKEESFLNIDKNNWKKQI